MRTLVTSWLVALVALSLAACGEERRPPVDERVTDEVTAQVAADTERLAREVARTGRQLAEDPQFREEARVVLSSQEREANRLAERARMELPRGDEARRGLVEANERTALAAARLRDFAPDPTSDRALDDAREELTRARDRAATAIDEIDAQLSPGERGRLQELRNWEPEIPNRP